MSSLQHIEFKNELLQSKLVTQLKQIVSDKLKEIEINKFRMDPELTYIVCKIVWNVCNDLGIVEADMNKPQLVIEILTAFFNLTPMEVEIVKKQIQHSLNHNKIKLVGLAKRIRLSLWNSLKKKITW